MGNFIYTASPIGGKKTGKASLPTVVRLKDGRPAISCSEVDDRGLDRDGTSATGVK